MFNFIRNWKRRKAANFEMQRWARVSPAIRHKFHATLKNCTTVAKTFDFEDRRNTIEENGEFLDRYMVICRNKDLTKLRILVRELDEHSEKLTMKKLNQ